MPLLIQEKINQHASWGLWHIAEDMESLVPPAGLSLQEEQALNSIKSQEKQLEWLASRRIIKTLASAHQLNPSEIIKDSFGKPWLLGSGMHISLSHSYPYAAAIINNQKETGIDIEHSREQLVRVQHKYLNAEELDCAGNHPEKLCVYWTAKEALYKVYGKKGLILKEHILINPFELAEAGTIEGALIINGEKYHYSLHYRNFQGLYICFSL